jgi:hypothetical protein
MNVTDLRAELDSRSRPGDDLIGVVRLAAVRNRVRTTKQRRIATGGATTLIVIVAVMTGYGLIGLAPSGTGPSAADNGAVNDRINGFARYAVGAVLVDTQSVTLPGAEIGMSTTASAFGLAFAQRCELTGPADPLVLWSVEQHAVGAFACDAGGDTYHTLTGSRWSDLGIRDGQTVRVTARLLTMGAGGDVVTVAGGTFAAALLRRVSFEQYPMPSRPGTLVPLDTVGLTEAGSGGTQIYSDPKDPSATRQTFVEQPAGLVIRLTAQTPGSIRVHFDGILVCTVEWWDYDADVQDCQYPSTWSTGTIGLRISLIPQRMKGAWRAWVRSR